MTTPRAGSQRKQVTIYTDGSCLGNPGPGGWCAILQLVGADYTREIGGGYRRTTNNRMELMGAINGLLALREPCDVSLHSDSQYLCNAVEKGWLWTWEGKRFWRKPGKPVPNADLWRILIPLLRTHSVHMVWLRGHMGHAENERCDTVARDWASRDNLPADEAYERSGGL